MPLNLIILILLIKELLSNLIRLCHTYSYIFFSDDLLLIQVDMEHDFFVGDVAVIVLVAIEGCKDGLVLPC